jgi:hypothetical protein
MVIWRGKSASAKISPKVYRSMGTVLVRYFWSELCSQQRTRTATVRLNGNVERGSPRAPWKDGAFQ